MIIKRHGCGAEYTLAQFRKLGGHFLQPLPNDDPRLPIGLETRRCNCGTHIVIEGYADGSYATDSVGRFVGPADTRREAIDAALEGKWLGDATITEYPSGWYCRWA